MADEDQTTPSHPAQPTREGKPGWQEKIGLEDIQIKKSDLRIRQKDFWTKVATIIGTVVIAYLGFGQQMKQLKVQADRQYDLAIYQANRQHELAKSQAEQQYELEKTKVNQEFWRLRAESCKRLSELAARVVVEKGKNRQTIEDVLTLALGPATIVKTPNSTAKTATSVRRTSMSTAISAYVRKLGMCQNRPADRQCWEDDLAPCARNIGYECANALCELRIRSKEVLSPGEPAWGDCPGWIEYDDKCDVPVDKAPSAVKL